jgi:glycosyltransferase involved in cell wall biosynthesis
MPKFYFIDESLCDVGGHHFGFAKLVLDAAAAFGYDVVLATHRSFTQADSLPASCRVHRLYPSRLYDDPLLMPCGERTGGDSQRGVHVTANWFERGRQWRFASRRRRWIAEHAAGTQSLFAQVPPSRGDQIFFAAAAEGTLRSLARLPGSGWPSGADCHFLFHFNPLAGTPPDYARQNVRRQGFARAFSALESAVSGQYVHYYTTTRELTGQFDSIFPGRIATLGYPIDPDFASARGARRAGEPLRIVFAGDARLEKGFQHLPGIVDALAPELAAGRARFVLQSNFPFAIPCRRRNLPLVAARERLARYPSDHVSLLGDPLDPPAYRELVTTADIGLMPYDPVHYHARCSGVLLEMLAAGVPVVVPAGGWMARQVEATGAGRVAEHISDFPRLLREIIGRYDRYKAAAEKNSADVLRRRHPRRFMAELLSHSTALAPHRRPQAA